MSVTKAAQVMGVGRPALSNLLNGRAALSPEMAARLEKAFGTPRKRLMQMQADFDAARLSEKKAPGNTRAYIPPFLGITARQIEDWVARNIRARIRLPVLVRTLVHSTGRGLKHVDFPGNDDAERPGADGTVEASEASPWIPSGRSHWELGTNADMKAKADEDFAKSVKALSAAERKLTTFIFVTPRHWKEKDTWIEGARRKAKWRDVRAYDAADLEQWIEQSLPAQAWFANESNLPSEGVRSLDRCWADWAGATTPPLVGAFFDSVVPTTGPSFLSKLNAEPPKPIVVSADSTDEAVAFLAQLFGESGGEELSALRHRVLVFERPTVLPRLAVAGGGFIAVALTQDVQIELASLARTIPSIIVCPRNTPNADPDVVLEPLDHQTFTRALEKMGKGRDDIQRLSSESARSLTILRRRLANVPTLRSPEWATEPQVTAGLVPFLLVGAWNSNNESDRQALSLLAGDRPYHALEQDVQALCQIADAPLWSVGSHRGVVSKIDLLHAIPGALTAADLERYFALARLVLSEDDPALDLDDEQRWAAALYKKTREFSPAFRQGISETLVLLAVYGERLGFKLRLGIDTQLNAARVVHEALPEPLNLRVLEANDRDLPTYAEAAPEAFLEILERDLRTESPASLALMRPMEPGILGHPSRTGLLWALENLCWNPRTLPRATLILARLADVELADNWVNKPINSLLAVFRAWMPQTAAGHDERVELMRMLAERFPKTAWHIAVSQINLGMAIGHYSHKPRWRPDGDGHGEPHKTSGPIRDFQREMLEVVLSWKSHSVETLSDLIETTWSVCETNQVRIWEAVAVWAATASDGDKATLREKVRVTTRSRRALARAKKHPVSQNVAKQIAATVALLEPRDLQNKHAWLFRDSWVQESADELEDDDAPDPRVRADKIAQLRVAAMREVWQVQGLSGLLDLAQRGQSSWTIGFLAARQLLSEVDLVALLRSAIAQLLKGDFRNLNELVSGAVHSVAEDDARELLIHAISSELDAAGRARVLQLAPFVPATWRLVDQLTEEGQARYWVDVAPSPLDASDEEKAEAVGRLLEVRRPRAAFSCVSFRPEQLEPTLLYRLLFSIARDDSERPDMYRLEHYSVHKAFEHIRASVSISLQDKALLEMAFVNVLFDRAGRGRGSSIPKFEEFVERNPDLFVRMIVWAYGRADAGEDPEDIRVPVERRQELGERGHSVLIALRRIPGHNEHGQLSADLTREWVSAVRRGCNELSRLEPADRWIGELLSNAPDGSDGVWPCEAVRDVMEEMQSESMMRGAHTGVYNARGMHVREPGGRQERALADKYRKWADALRFSHPFVSSHLLMALANTYEHEGSYHDTYDGLRRRME